MRNNESIAIVGGGIAGLALALGLHRRGIECRVYEVAPEIRPLVVGITILVGIVITIIAWAGQIQIIAFKDINLSYDRPVVIFIIGLIGALGGVHYLNNWAKKYLPHDTTPQKEA